MITRRWVYRWATGLALGLPLECTSENNPGSTEATGAGAAGPASGMTLGEFPPDMASGQLPPGMIEPFVLDEAFRVHRVARGETLSTIARRYHVPGGVAELVRENALENANLVREGSGLKLRVNEPFTHDLPPLRLVQPFTGALTPCAAKTWSAPVVRSLDPGLQARGCYDGENAGCARAPDGREICACYRDDLPDDTYLFTYVDHTGAIRASLQSPINLGGYVSFEVKELDLDGDGKDEVVLGVHRDTLNGIPFTIWDLVVFFPNGEHLPMRFTASEFGPESFVTRDDGAPGCDAMPGEMAWILPPLRYAGLYYVRRRYHVTRGALVPVRTPLLVERTGGSGTQLWPIDVVANKALRSLEATAVTAVKLRSRSGMPDFLAFEVQRGGEATTLPDTYDEPLRIGDRATGIAWPEGYVPSDPRAFVGMRAELASYGESVVPAAKLQRVLWLRSE